MIRIVHDRTRKLAFRQGNARFGLQVNTNLYIAIACLFYSEYEVTVSIDTNRETMDVQQKTTPSHSVWCVRPLLLSVCRYQGCRLEFEEIHRPVLRHRLVQERPTGCHAVQTSLRQLSKVYAQGCPNLFDMNIIIMSTIFDFSFILNSQKEWVVTELAILFIDEKQPSSSVQTQTAMEKVTCSCNMVEDHLPSVAKARPENSQPSLMSPGFHNCEFVTWSTTLGHFADDKNGHRGLTDEGGVRVEPGSCLQRLMGSVKTGVILKDVSLEVNGGEVLAILGSKGSGKRALLEVISRRAQGPTRGQIILNGAPMSLRLFQQSCGYVTHKCDLLPGLNVEQTLYYAAQLTIGSQVSRYMKRSRVKQVMADLALSQVANRSTDDITQMVLLLDEPTWDLDPLNTYLVISILSNHARKYGRAVVLTMEKPRSDVFPFLDRVTYLCLGDVVYTGATRLMLHYFRSIVCLSTVDRRSRERFIESNHQIAALVEKFKLEGGPFRKSSAVKHEGLMMENPDNLDSGGASRVPLSAFGHPGSFNVAVSLYMRYMESSFNFRPVGLTQMALRLLALPIFYLLLWIFYSGMELSSQKNWFGVLLFHCWRISAKFHWNMKY
uniref:ABC transporter domain-containing protein n=1 Tax=Timema shepardi TaxID=629360 RepID=A0A7R9G4G9_TIMSH|nr:unnamed protein product [Timema shepardi]